MLCHQRKCNYLIVLQAALCFYDEFNVLAGESHQLTVAGSQIDVLKEIQQHREVNQLFDIVHTQLVFKLHS